MVLEELKRVKTYTNLYQAPAYEPVITVLSLKRGMGGVIPTLSGPQPHNPEKETDRHVHRSDRYYGQS